MARAKVKTQQQPAAKNGDGADFGPKPQPVAAAPHNGPVSTKGSMAHEKITLSQLEGFLFKSADILRGKMDACSTSTILAGRRQLFLPVAARLMFGPIPSFSDSFHRGDVDGRDPLRGPTINVASRPVSPASRPSFRRLRWARSVGVFACDSSAR